MSYLHICWALVFGINKSLFYISNIDIVNKKKVFIECKNHIIDLKELQQWFEKINMDMYKQLIKNFICNFDILLLEIISFLEIF